MQNLEKLASLTDKLPKDLVANAKALVTRMGEVIEGLGDKPIEWRPETLKLVQGTSDRGKLPKGAGIGSIILGEDIAEQPLEVIVLRTYTTRQYWNPDPEQAQMLCNSPDGDTGYQYGNCRICPYSKFDTENNRSQCNKTLTVLCLAADLTRVFFVNFSKTNYSNGTDWQKLMRTAGVAPYKRIYSLSSETSKKSKNVEALKAEPVLNKKVEGDLLAFVEELFNTSGTERKEYLKKYYELVDARKLNQANQLTSNQDSHTMELVTVVDETSEADVSNLKVVQEEKAEAVKSAGQKYSL
jgi:hypothetical protein